MAFAANMPERPTTAIRWIAIVLAIAALTVVVLAPALVTLAVVPVLGMLAIGLMRRATRQRATRVLPLLIHLVVIATACAARDDSLSVWQVPDNWPQLLQLSTAGLVAFLAMYLLAAIGAAVSGSRHLRLREAITLLVLPVQMNIAFVLASTPLMAAIGKGLPGHDVSAHALVLAGLGLSLCISFGMLTRGRPSGDWKLYALVAVVGAVAAVTPMIANAPVQAAVLPSLVAAVFGAGCAAFAQAGLWCLVYVFTGLAMDAVQRRPPTALAALAHAQTGLVKGAIFGGCFMALLLLASAVLRQPFVTAVIYGWPLPCAVVFGALLYPLAVTIISSADETPPFFERFVAAYREPRTYLRGAVVGGGIGLATTLDLADTIGATRFSFGFAIGALAYGGVDMLFDALRVLRGIRMHVQDGRIYLLGLLLGGCVGGALGWYFDARQLAVVIEKFWTYADLDFASAGRAVSSYGVTALFSKWGNIDLGTVTGGVRLFFDESLSGAINFGIAAPLFSLNYFLLSALFQRRLWPLRQMLSADGIEGLVQQTIRVLRWGLWMAPVIYSFLRMQPDPSWYNQDGAVRSLLATGAQAIMPEPAFRAWSLMLFTGVLAFDWLRVLVWIDHMGLRVATLVNLSFVGGDALDAWASRFLGHAARTRVIPEGIRRFATWAPLLIPFYIPRGADWDAAWSGAEQMRAGVATMPPPIFQITSAYAAAGLLGLVLVVILASRLSRPRGLRSGALAVPDCIAVQRPKVLSNGLIASEVWPDGRGFTHLHDLARDGHGIDITRRRQDPLQLRGQFVYLSDLDGNTQPWSIGYEPVQRADVSYAFDATAPDMVEISNAADGVRAAMQVSTALDECCEKRRIVITNKSRATRRLALTTYVELALAEPDAYLRDADYNALHVETWFVAPLQTLIARNRLLRDGARREKLSRMSPEASFQTIRVVRGNARLVAYEDSRTRFLGHGSPRQPDGLAAGYLRDLADEGHLHTFDPASAFRVELELGLNESCEIMLYTGHADSLDAAAALAARCLEVDPLASAKLDVHLTRQRILRPLSPRGSEPVFAFSEQGNALSVGPLAPRPWAHLLANPLGHGVIATNRGSVYSYSGNGRHNGLTSWCLDPSATTCDGQVVYVRDVAGDVTTSLGADPIDNGEKATAEFAPGRVTYSKQLGVLELRMDLFVPPEVRADIRILSIRNSGDSAKRLRVGAYFDLALDEHPAASLGTLDVEARNGVVLARNDRNAFVSGTAYVTTSLTGAHVETIRNRFIGADNRDLANPAMIATGAPDRSVHDDERRIAGFCADLDVTAGQTVEIVILLGQAEDDAGALSVATRLRGIEAARAALAETQDWWTQRLAGPRVSTGDSRIDRFINPWLAYQLLVSRLWGRIGPNQRGGAVGYRDQLQDVLPLLFHAPDLARQQIVLHAAQQFCEGDVLKWWHPAADGRTGLGLRSRASDPHLWLPYIVSHYLRATGDDGLLRESVAYLEGPAVPAHASSVLVAPRASRDRDDVYGHCLRAIFHSLEWLGPHGLPLFGAGDWNDGIDIAGLHGRGESVWLAFFLHRVIIDFIPIADSRGDEAIAEDLRRAAEDLAKATESAWQDGRYILGFDDAGQPIRQASILTAAWPSLSGAVTYERGLAALRTGLRDLEKPDRILLLAPPFDETSDPYPGRIADYPPGVRENGAQYSHGSSWAVDAWLQLSELAQLQGDMSAAQDHADRASATWRKISPIDKLEDDKLWTYGLAPHQQPADVYDGAGHAGRGGWSWYTGSAARMLSCAYALAGLDMESGRLTHKPRPYSRTSDIIFRARSKADKRAT